MERHMPLKVIEDLPSTMQAGTQFILVSTPTNSTSNLPPLDQCDRLVANTSFDFAVVAYEYSSLFEGDPTYRSKWERIRSADPVYRDRYLRQYFIDYLVRRGLASRSDRPLILFDQSPYRGICVSRRGEWTFHVRTIRTYLREIENALKAGDPNPIMTYGEWFHRCYLKEQ